MMDVDVREFAGKGLCLFAAKDFRTGDIVLREPFLFESRTEDHPAIFSLLARMHDREPFTFGHIRSHYAAVASWLTASSAARTILLQKHVPRDDHRLRAEEVDSVLTELKRGGLLTKKVTEAGSELTAGTLWTLIMSWEYNGFAGTNGSLVMYDKVSRASHSCAPNCEVVTIHGLHRSRNSMSSEQDLEGKALDGQKNQVLRQGDRFDCRFAGLAFRAKIDVQKGDELTFCYCLTEEDLAQDFQHRRQQLQLRGWKFLCHCSRCMREVHEFLHPPAELDGKKEDDEEEVLGKLQDLFADI
eukprot:TRINITY_DN63158_c0_g1_i1.p1 TRINITY_DN63158_c0_g1~~TRINITY_DN63158_c0_g1_i1.p1  ORF type:complete len:300 (+),score=64.89 TRINITY_DN63158_c0_g1_i1:46-945(+)